MTTHSAVLTSSMIQAIISRDEILRGKSGIVYGGKSVWGKQFYQVLRYVNQKPTNPSELFEMETVYEGTYAMAAADAYIDLTGCSQAHEDAMKHIRARNNATSHR
jgi:hypothetical protein